jgi:hypothetical protein
MYITYEEYVDMGGSVSEGAFNRLETKARAAVDRVTFGRLKNESPMRDAVRYCMFDLINAANADDSAGAITAGREIAAMSNDGISVSFASSGGASASVAARQAAIVREWLAAETDAYGTPLLYAGVSVI